MDLITFFKPKLSFVPLYLCTNSIPVLAQWIEDKWGYIRNRGVDERIKILTALQDQIWVGFYAGKPIAMFGLLNPDMDAKFTELFRESNLKIPNTGHLSYVYIDEPYRGWGLSKQILDHVKLKAREKGVDRIVLDTLNPKLNPLYKKAGASVVADHHLNYVPTEVLSLTTTSMLITGASKGIGLACAEYFAQQGFQIYATTRDPEHALDLKALAAKFSNIQIIRLDVTDSEDTIRTTLDAIPSVDILLNNAGIGLCGPVETSTNIQNRSVFDTNFFGVLNVTNAILPKMRDRNKGLIINLDSIVGPTHDPKLPLYSASKAALGAVMDALKEDLKDAGYDINVCQVNPGPVLTPFESATPNGQRFTADDNPYPQTKANRDKWSRIMIETGRPVLETVLTVAKVIQQVRPKFWNPTNDVVAAEFARVYQDPTGESCLVGGLELK